MKPFSEGSSVPESVTDQRLRTALARFERSRGAGYDWDPELFAEAFGELDAEFREAGPEARRNILTRRYFDATEPIDRPGLRESEFQERFAISVPSFSPARADRLEDGNILRLALPNASNMREPVLARQYGPSRVFDLPQGEWAEVGEMGEQDAMGTSSLTMCTALLARDGGRLLMGHVISSRPEDILALARLAEERGYAKERTRLFMPFWKQGDGSENRRWNEAMAAVATEAGIRPEWFPYVGYDTHNPNDIRGTTLVAGLDLTRTVGVHYVPAPAPEKGFRRSPRRSVPREKTTHDYRV